MSNRNDKKFDAVKTMREIREKLSSEYEKDPTKQKKDLESIRKKYGLTRKSSKRVK